MADYPENYSFQSSNKTLHWDGVAGSEEYQIEYATDPQQTNWTIAYSNGTDLSCSFDKSAGTYYIKGKSKKRGKWDIYSPVESIEVTP